MYRSRIAATAVVDVLALVLLRPELDALRAAVGDPRGWLAAVGADRALATATGCVLWLVAVRVGVGLLAAALAGLPGAPGRVAAALARIALPAVVARILIGTTGLGVLLVPLSAQARGVAGDSTAPTPAPTSTVSAPAGPVPGPAWPSTGSPASTPTRTPAAPLPGPAWPHPAPRPTVTPTVTPTDTPPPSPRPRAEQPTPQPTPQPGAPRSGGQRRIEVHRGDCLWLIAARRLGPSAEPSRIADDVAGLYAANRAVIGADPDLVTPGQVLDVPSPAGPSPRAQESP